MKSRSAIRIAGVVAGLASAIALTACGSDTEHSGKPTVVASTNVWGDIAAQIAGPDATVSAIIGDPNIDPHSYETTATDSAKIADASLVVYNGGGYDEFAAKAIGGRNKKTVQAFESRTDRADQNEHVWYDVTTVGTVADRIAAALGEIDTANAAAYADRAAAFRARLGAITAIAGKIAADHPKTPVLQTEPIAHYLLRTAAAEDRTPREFQNAIEQETDPAPATVAAVRELLTGKQVRALIYNVQTEDKTTEGLRDIARSAGVPVVEVTETLPSGTDYVQWQTKNAQALATALS
ncbi:MULTISPECIES: metal ABC transporter solute-binding protein, Zn/Mn family [unclassified Nocardia]|uniref:metal ABC transporter solute-binding protein, Zn/Mn family n=1 Tax=unclassified Nocardia TaxID=2637762 RepID=UPI001CE4033F|nr:MULTISPECIES: zinc ABC transporter substrate-binding protein [unclassified Nocardia]